MAQCLLYARNKLLTKPRVTVWVFLGYFSEQSGFQQSASATVETTSGSLIMILLAQYHLTEENICKLVSAEQFPGSYSLVQEDYELPIHPEL